MTHTYHSCYLVQNETFTVPIDIDAPDAEFLVSVKVRACDEII